MLFYLLVLDIFFTWLLWWIIFLAWTKPKIDNEIIENNFINFAKYALDNYYVNSNNEWFNVELDKNWDFQLWDSNQIKQWFYKFWRYITKNEDTIVFKYLDNVKWKCFFNQVNWWWKRDLCDWEVVSNNDLKILYNEWGWWSLSNWYIPIFKNRLDNSDWKWVVLHIFKVWWYDKLYKIELVKIINKYNWNYTYKILSYFYY